MLTKPQAAEKLIVPQYSIDQSDEGMHLNTIIPHYCAELHLA
jgi:hypothetical protein